MTETKVRVTDTIANPAPLGLLGFGMTTILLNIHNAGWAPLNVAIISIGIFYGGIAQIIAGIMEYKKGNTFGATAFTSYGAFWISLVGIWWLPKAGFNAASADTVGWFLTLWGIFSLFMFFCTLRQTKANQVVFGSLVLLFALLAIGEFTEKTAVTHLAGYVGIFCGASAMYTAMAQIVNETYGKKVMPL
ncbi:MAG: acetate uptake transporter [Negativicutes bacterium]|jgi:hypothetical protein